MSQDPVPPDGGIWRFVSTPSEPTGGSVMVYLSTGSAQPLTTREVDASAAGIVAALPDLLEDYVVEDYIFPKVRLRAQKKYLGVGEQHDWRREAQARIGSSALALVQIGVRQLRNQYGGLENTLMTLTVMDGTTRVKWVREDPNEVEPVRALVFEQDGTTQTFTTSQLYTDDTGIMEIGFNDERPMQPTITFGLKRTVSQRPRLRLIAERVMRRFDAISPWPITVDDPSPYRFATSA